MKTDITDQIRPLELLVLQSTSFCNINCKYCYLADRSITNKMTLETIERVFALLFKNDFVSRDFTIVWHAGEPLTLSPDYYYEAFKIIEKYKPETLNVKQSFQTNGLLIDQKWCDLFKEISATVGISIDGPEFIHDKYRLKRNSKGTHKSALSGLKRLRENNIPNHVIAVLTRYSLDYPDEIFDFFIQHRVRNLGFNIEEKEGINKISSLSEVEDLGSSYTGFIRRIYQRYKESQGEISIREFEQLFQLIINTNENHTNSQTTPGTILSVDWKGNISTFSPELLGVESNTDLNNFLFGNVYTTDNFDLIFRSQSLQKANKLIQQGVSKCKNSCDYFSLCGGGAPSNKFFENNDLESTETMYCKLTKQLISDVILADLEASVNRIPRV